MVLAHYWIALSLNTKRFLSAVQHYSKDDPDREQMDDYTDFLNGSSKLAMIRVSADPKKSDCGCKAKAVPQNTQKPSSTPQGKKTSKANKMRETWDVIVTNAENLWK